MSAKVNFVLGLDGAGAPTVEGVEAGSIGGLQKVIVDPQTIKKLVSEFVGAVVRTRLEDFGASHVLEKEIEERALRAVRDAVDKWATPSTMQAAVRRLIEEKASKEIVDGYEIEVAVSVRPKGADRAAEAEEAAGRR